MANEPTFTRGWKAAIVVALIFSVLSANNLEQKYAREIEEKLRRSEQRIDELESSIKKIERYLYENPRK